MDFSIKHPTLNKLNNKKKKLTSKKYVEIIWKFVEIWISMYLCNIDVESTWIRHGVLVGK